MTRAASGRRGAAGQSHRLSLVVGAPTWAAIGQVRAGLDAASWTEAIRAAVLIVARLVAEARAGSRLMLQRRDGSTAEVILPVVGDLAAWRDEA